MPRRILLLGGRTDSIALGSADADEFSEMEYHDRQEEQDVN